LNHLRCNRLGIVLLAQIKKTKEERTTDIHSRNQYLERLQERYFMTRSKKEKSSILDEYLRNTHQNRKYVIRKTNYSFSSMPKKRKKKRQIYDGCVRAVLAQVWDIFDRPCGQRLASS
jgi:hypothetical protein